MSGPNFDFYEDLQAPNESKLKGPSQINFLLDVSSNSTTLPSKPAHPKANMTVNPVVLIVQGLKWWITAEDLQEYFETYGQLQYVRVYTNEINAASLGVAAVAFVTAEAADTALSSSNNLSWKECVLTVTKVVNSMSFNRFRDIGSPPSIVQVEKKIRKCIPGNGWEDIDGPNWYHEKGLCPTREYRGGQQQQPAVPPPPKPIMTMSSRGKLPMNMAEDPEPAPPPPMSAGAVIHDTLLKPVNKKHNHGDGFSSIPTVDDIDSKQTPKQHHAGGRTREWKDKEKKAKAANRRAKSPSKTPPHYNDEFSSTPNSGCTGSSHSQQRSKHYRRDRFSKPPRRELREKSPRPFSASSDEKLKRASRNNSGRNGAAKHHVGYSTHQYSEARRRKRSPPLLPPKTKKRRKQLSSGSDSASLNDILQAARTGTGSGSDAGGLGGASFAPKRSKKDKKTPKRMKEHKREKEREQRERERDRERERTKQRPIDKSFTTITRKISRGPRELMMQDDGVVEVPIVAMSDTLDQLCTKKRGKGKRKVSRTPSPPDILPIGDDDLRTTTNDHNDNGTTTPPPTASIVDCLAIAPATAHQNQPTLGSNQADKPLEPEVQQQQIPQPDFKQGYIPQQQADIPEPDNSIPPTTTTHTHTHTRQTSDLVQDLPSRAEKIQQSDRTEANVEDKSQHIQPIEDTEEHGGTHEAHVPLAQTTENEEKPLAQEAEEQTEEALQQEFSDASISSISLSE